jgi:hypothetical protein
MESPIHTIYNKILNNSNKTYQTIIQNISLKLLNEKGFDNLILGNKDFLNDPLRPVRRVDFYDAWNDHKQLCIHACRTDINIMKPLANNNIFIKILFTAGAINNAFEMMFEFNEQDNYRNLMNKLCPNIMDNVEWAPLKQYIMNNNNIRRANDILLYFVPPECNAMNREFAILLADPSLPDDLDDALPRLPWFHYHPCITIQQILSFMNNFSLLITPVKEFPGRGIL